MSTGAPFDAVEVSNDYTTSGESVVYVESGNGAITITLAAEDVQKGNTLRIVDTDGQAASNNITVQTEGSESIFPGGGGSLAVSVNHAYVRIWSDGDNWFAERNTQVNQISIEESSTKAYLSSNQTLTSGSTTKVNIDTTRFDHLGIYDSGNNQFVLNEGGQYLIGFGARFLSDSNFSTGDLIVPSIDVNGNKQADPQLRKVGTGLEDFVTPPDVYDLSSGDTIEFYMRQDSGSDQTIEAGQFRTYMTITKVG